MPLKTNPFLHHRPNPLTQHPLLNNYNPTCTHREKKKKKKPTTQFTSLSIMTSQVYFREWIYHHLQQGKELGLHIVEEKDASILKKLIAYDGAQ